MSIRTIPCRVDSPFYDFTVELDGAVWRLTFRWNAREQAWYFDLADGADVLQLSSRKVVLNRPLLSRYRTRATLPAGELVAVDTSNTNAAPGLGELGGRVVLYYVDVDDLAEARSI
jgi:hypothetical protein